MPEEVTIKVEEDSPSSPAPNPPPQTPGAETVIQAAIQTGAAAEKAETAAAEATETLAEAKGLEARLKASLMPELTAIADRLTALEEMEAEETEEEPAISDSQESAEIVSLEEPLAVEKKEETKQEPAKEPERARGGFLRKMFLNL